MSFETVLTPPPPPSAVGVSPGPGEVLHSALSGTGQDAAGQRDRQTAEGPHRAGRQTQTGQGRTGQ